MIYKIKTDDDYLEVTQSNKNEISVKVVDEISEATIYLDDNQLYKLIGSLHLLQKDLRNE